MLLNKWLAKGHHRFRGGKRPACLGVKRAGGTVRFVCPQFHSAVPLRTREIHAGCQKPASQPLATCAFAQQKQPQFRGIRIKLDAEDTAQPLISLPCNPARFTIRVVVRYEIIDNLRHKHAESLIKPFRFRVMILVLCDQPIPISGGKLANLNPIHGFSMRFAPLAFQGLSG